MRASRKLIRAFVVPRTISLRHESPAQAQARDSPKARDSLKPETQMSMATFKQAFSN